MYVLLNFNKQPSQAFNCIKFGHNIVSVVTNNDFVIKLILILQSHNCFQVINYLSVLRFLYSDASYC